MTSYLINKSILSIAFTCLLTSCFASDLDDDSCKHKRHTHHHHKKSDDTAGRENAESPRQKGTVDASDLLSEVDESCESSGIKAIPQETPEQARAKVKTVRILEVDGGAMRGIMPAVVLREIEKRTGKSIAETFHFVGGTSIGCFLTAGLTIPSDEDPAKPKWKAEDIITILREEAPKVFRPYLWGSLYNTPALEDISLKYCGNKTFDQSVIPTMGMTFNCLATQPMPIRSWGQKEIFRTQDVMLSSSAVPLVFHPRVLYPVNFNASINSRYLVADGFLGANNSSAILVAEAKQLFPNATKFEVVSLGNGIMKDPLYYKIFRGTLTLGNYALKLFDLGLNTVSAEPDEYMESLLNGPYTRINPLVVYGSGGPFDASKSNLDGLEKDTMIYLEENEKYFGPLIERLKKPKD